MLNPKKPNERITCESSKRNPRQHGSSFTRFRPISSAHFGKNDRWINAIHADLVRDSRSAYCKKKRRFDS